MKIFRIIGNEGRITIPYAIRQAIGFLPDDVVSFQLMEDDSVLVRREALRGKEKIPPGSGRDASLIAFLESLDEKQRYSAWFTYLSCGRRAMTKIRGGIWNERIPGCVCGAG